MGLDIKAWEKATLTDPHERTDDCYDEGHVRAFVYDGFERSLRGLEPNRCYLVGGDHVAFQAGSYGGYGEFRRALCQAALHGVTPEQVWADPDSYAGRPFFELIQFADNEGTIGPEAAADLATDFANERVRVVPRLARAGDAGWMVAKYGKWQKACELAAGTGLVEFR
jgi:hypothetical protein